MDNKDIHNTTEASLEGILNYCIKPNVPNATKNIDYKATDYNSFILNIKKESNSSYHVASSDSEDSESEAYTSINNKNKKQDKMCELASTSNEKDVNVSESNSQELTDTKLVEGKILRTRTSSGSTASPIMKILSPKSVPHTCRKCCFMCNMVFRVLDNPLHICQIRGIDKKNEFLKIQTSLCVDSCLCDFCWKYLEKTYKSNKSKNRKEESYSEKKSKFFGRYEKKNVSKNQNPARMCSIHLCSQPNFHKMSVKECKNINNLFLTFESCRLVFVKSTKQTTDSLKFPFCLCKIHNSMILVMSSCQICGIKLNAPFNTDDWSMYEMWNFVLIQNNLPIILKPGMFICGTCKVHISQTNSGFPITDLPRLQRYIRINNAIRLNLYGGSQHNLFNTCKQSPNEASPIVVPKIKERKECVRSIKVKFSDPLITKNHNNEIGYCKNNTKSITSTALLNVAEQNLYTPKLDPKDEELDFVKLGEEYCMAFTANKPKDQSFYRDPTPNTSRIEMTNSSNKSFYDTSENILSQQNPSANLTDNNVSNNFFKCAAATNHVVRHGDNNNLLPLHIDQLKNYDNKISKNEGINQYLGISNYNSLQNLCQVRNVETYENKSEIIIGSHQVVNGQNEIENNQSKLKSHAICRVAQDRISMDLKEDTQCMNEINTIHKTVYLDETDNSMYTFIAAVEPPNEIVNPVSLKRKQSNVICDTISNKDVKKQRLDEKYSSYENNSTNNTTKSYKNKDIAHPSINSPSCLNMTSNCINENDPNSDISDSEWFSETDSEKISDCEIKETDFIVVASDDDLSLDSDCELVESELEIKPDGEIKETDFIVVASDDDLSLDSDCELVESELEIKPDGEIKETDFIVVASDDDLSLDSDCELVESELEIKPDGEIKETDFIVVASDDDLSLDSDCELVESELEIKPDCEIKETDFIVVASDDDLSLDSDCELVESELEIKPDCEIKETDFLVVASDDDLSLDSDSELVESESEIKPDGVIEMDCKFVSDSEKSLDGKIMLNGENVLENYTTLLDSVKDSNCEIMPDAVTESVSDEQPLLNISVIEEKFNSKKLSTFGIVSNVQKGSDCEILLDRNNVFETASGSEKGMIKYRIISDDEIKSSGNKGSTCIIISDNDEESNNKVFTTHKINIQKGTDSKILLDGQKVNILSENENSKVMYKIETEKSKCIIISDNRKKFINKNLSTLKLVSNVKKRSASKILDIEKVYDAESKCKNRKIKYIIVSKAEIKSSGNKEFLCTTSSDIKEKFNNKNSTFKMFVKNFQKGSHNVLLDGEKYCEMLSGSENGRIKCIFASDNEEKFNYKKVSDTKIITIDDSRDVKTLNNIKTINSKMNNDSQLQIKYRYSFPCLEMTVNEDDDAELDKIQDYFKEFISALRYYFENTKNQSFKELYSQMDNDFDMILYLMENLRMFYNEELYVTETCDEFCKDYLKEQKIILHNCFGDPKDSINASMPFIHPSSYLHQYSTRLSFNNIEPLIIKDITTTTSSSTQINSIDSTKKNVAAIKVVGSKFKNIGTTKLLPLCNSVSKSRNNIMPTNSLDVPSHLVTCTKPLLTSGIPYLPDDDQTFTRLKLNHPVKCGFQFSVAIKKKTGNES